MRVLLCKIACPGSECFCKPSPSIYAPSPLRLVSSPPSNASSDTSSDPETPRVIFEGESAAQINDKQSNGDHLKSSIKRHGSHEAEKKSKRVQWLDVTGKQLAEVREFESSEREDVDSGYYSSRACLCTIL